MNNLPIRYKLITHFLIISILPSIVLGLLTSWTVDNIIEKKVNENTLQLIGKVNRTLEFYVSNMQNITYFIAFNRDIKNFLYTDSKAEPGESQRYEMEQFLQGFPTLYSEIAGIMVINRHGKYVSNEMYTLTPDNLTDEDWYKQAVDNKGIFTIVGHPYERNVTTHVNYNEDEVISVARAVLDPDTQQVLGVILIDLKLRVIAETVKDVRLGKSGFLMVIDQHGEPIYSPSYPIAKKIPKEWFMIDGAGTFSRKVDDSTLQFIYRTSSFTNWTTVGVFSTQDPVQEVSEIRLYLYSFVFIVCLLGIAASFYLSYSISKPIWQLMAYMQKAETGDLTINRWGTRQDEVGMLGRRFNMMMRRIKKLIALVERQERQKREAELRSLQAHIKPHFLYNTLDTIQWLARKNGAHEVTEVVKSLSRLFRIGLSKGNEIIPLVDEIEHINSYLKIQETRYRSKLNYSIEMDPEIRQCFVLKLILQPIVENAIYHGIKQRRGPGHIHIAVRAADEKTLRLTVTDDGVGMREDILAELQKELQQVGSGEEKEIKSGEISGYGIKNVQARIRLTFGEAYGLSVESAPGKGTTVTILHPLIHESRED